MTRTHLPFVALVFVCAAVYGQQADSVLLHSSEQLDSLFSQGDSLSIFSLLDSLMTMPVPETKSQLAVRLSYNSNVNAVSQSLNINQFGLSPGVSYYHKSGAYADIAGYWSNQYDPKHYYLTILSGGYLFTFSKKWTALAEYNKYLYNKSDVETTSIPYTNSLGLSNFFRVKPLLFRLDYYFYFGERSANRLLPGVSLNLEKRHWHGITRVLLYPTFSALMGNEVILDYEPYSRSYLVIIYRIRHGLPLYKEIQKNVFGMMNYSLSLPLSVQVKNWNFFVNYVYNFPQALPGEQLAVARSGYLSASITRYLNFK